MISRRKIPDGLPFRLYKHDGVRDVSYYYKLPGGKRAFTLTASKADKEGLTRIRRSAIERAEELNGAPREAGTFARLKESYFDWQYSMPEEAPLRKANITLTENKREAENLVKVFGMMRPTSITTAHIYRYLDSREVKTGKRKGEKAYAKANKEIALLSAILEYGRRKGELEVNPCKDIDYNPTTPNQKYVDQPSIEFALDEARRRTGDRYLVMMLCVKTAYLTSSRPSEMRALTRSASKPEGLEIPVGKRKKGQARKTKLIEWSPELKATVEEALTLQRTTSMFIFGNRDGQEYSRSGWGTNLNRLMSYCVKRAEQETVPFTRLTLADMRPASVTDRKEAGEQNIKDATGHASERMIDLTYDRRKRKVAKATK